MRRRDKIIFFLLILIGLGLLNYPFISQWVNRRSQSSVIYGYQEQTGQLTDDGISEMLEAAREYNRKLAAQQLQLEDGFSAEQSRDKEYESLLNPGGNGVMGWIEIPVIDVMIPIYHGTGVAALESGAGHLYQSSLPVGGTDTHAVLSAHTGLASKALFTDLDKLEKKDRFFLYILDETLAYEVTDITVVLPEETDSLRIVPGEDFVTLVTCTPYGINSHRLLVTGKRIPWEPEKKQAEEVTEERGLWKWSQRLFILSVIVLAVTGILLIKPKRKGGDRNHEQER